MDRLLEFESVDHIQCIMDCSEECGFSGEYTLPEYCPDVAVVLKCFAQPLMQNRQISGDKLLLDGIVNLRVLYLAEQRHCIHSVEFSVPYSCTLRGEDQKNDEPIFMNFATKYVNCRAVGPRRFEVHGAVQLTACGYGNCEMKKAVTPTDERLYTQCSDIALSKMVGAAEKILTVSEVLEFPESLPAAEMLLGGTCTALVKEWKVLSGKVIVRGVLLVHQLYTDHQEKGTTQCLDFEIPFSHILDINGAREGYLCRGDVQILADTERCLIGPDGGNTLLEVTAKLLVQAHVYESDEISVLVDAYHGQFPVELTHETYKYKAYLGCCNEQTVLPMVLECKEYRLSEIIDILVHPQNLQEKVENQVVCLSGSLLVSILGRDVDGEIVYLEKTEEYRLEFPAKGNTAEAKIDVCDLRYRAVDGRLEMQVDLSCWLYHYHAAQAQTVKTLNLNREQPYEQSRASALLYYAVPGESLWDIGRSCHTSPELIRQENASVSETVKQPCVLMVPLV